MARKDVDTLLGYLGHPGRYQIMVFFLLMWQYFPMCFNCLAMIMLAGKPLGAHCASPRTVSVYDPLRNSTEVVFSCDPGLDFRPNDSIAKCSKYGVVRRNWTAAGDGSYSNRPPETCLSCHELEYEFDYPSETTIISEFNLICEDYWQVGLATTLNFLGMLVGGPLFGFASDKYGRKPALLAASGFTFLVGFGVTFAPNYTTFLIFRFLIGLGIQGASLCAFTLMVETFPKQYREFAGVGAQLFWAGGVILLGGFGYVLPNWRHLQLLISLSVVVSLAYVCFVKESLRWLYINQRFNEAADVTHYMLHFNRKKHTKKIADCADYLALWYQKEHEDEEKSANSFVNLFTSPQLRRRVLGMSYIWFTASIWYYAISFAITDFIGSKYINLAVAGVIDFLITVACMYIVKRFGCRLPMFYCLVMGGVLAIVAGCLPATNLGFKIARTVLGQLSRGMAHAVFNMMFPYASDLLPTAVRANGLGLCSAALRFGGVLAPQLDLLGTYVSKEVPFVVCGLMGLLAALVTFVLPETRGVPLPETVDDLHTQSKRRSHAALEMR
ncbi:Solute carrier family 22 member 3 [Hypsibius exemplaris]|uniref:Solute carrier family 22 member 3 n=1 Tax=Hypsibius exemplaris TaxID=2072580 RepID=A0A1W0WIW1_HYPEX|nr:Solute carrier family 22 member 3 [Hypsibius exemplaris]